MFAIMVHMYKVH